ncbi:MAG: hypothetical protein H6747_04895 [Deltaproteobacteria bacterium]|nr:hypothetical protein [Deltaproteobacteria bacterium]
MLQDGYLPLDGPAGQRLIDYSWAGYQNGAVALPQPASPGVDVQALGADPSGATDSTAAIQQAIDQVAAAGGGTVWLPKGLYRVDGTLLVQAADTVLRGAGAALTRLHFTRHEKMSFAAHLTFRGKPKADVVALPYVAPGSTVDPNAAWTDDVVTLPPGATLAVGDEVALTQLVTEGFVAEHGMTGTWKAFAGDRVRIWRSRVAAVAPAAGGGVALSLQPAFPGVVRHRDQPRIERITGYLKSCGVVDLAVGNAVDWEAAWAQDQVAAIAFEGAADGWALRVESFDPPGPQSEGVMPGAHLQSAGIRIHDSTRMTVQDCHLQKAQNRGGGGNGYLFEIRQSTHVLTRGCSGRHGRHNFIQNWGFGTAACVWSGILSEGGKAMFSPLTDLAPTGFSEFHHSLAMFNLIEDSVLHDGWAAQNRGDESSGAGHTATETTMWNLRGDGVLISRNYGHGYVIGTAPSLQLTTSTAADGLSKGGLGTEPVDWVEGAGVGASLWPQSLWACQRAHRLGLGSCGAP